jgi:hypothetical protein
MTEYLQEIVYHNYVEFRLQNKTFTVVTDNRANIVAAINFLKAIYFFTLFIC